jgi:alkanesulfonate monooxygenase SsuD/methylene tetrahydromethanopterin reductase-like flavin-dependent oxidoreductase (luciferase family)/predicted kinase
MWDVIRLTPMDQPREPLNLVAGTLIVLVGASGSGKSTWAREMFPTGGVISTDAMRALVGEGEADQRANRDMFALFDDVLAARVKRKLTTVVDSTALDADRRAIYVNLARRFGVPITAIVFRATLATCLDRNSRRDRHVPTDVVRAQVQASLAVSHQTLTAEGFQHVIEIEVDRSETRRAVRLVPAPFVSAPVEPGFVKPIRIELAVSRFNWPGGAVEMRSRLTDIAQTAEEVGVTGIWLMDHYRQIPQVGQPWEDLPELISTLGFLAGITTKARLGSLVASISARTISQLARSMASLDVLSSGRIVCGLGIGWFEAEAAAVGAPLPPRSTRYELLEDSLHALPLFWGKGAPSFTGHHLEISEAMAYPRPLQQRLPLLVGGTGRRTLKLAARHADAVNIQGSREATKGHIEFLRSQMIAAGRSTDSVEVTHLGPILVGTTDADLTQHVERLRGRTGDQRFRATNNAGTVDDHVTRFAALADAGIDTAIVAPIDLGEPGALSRVGTLIEKLREVSQTAE